VVGQRFLHPELGIQLRFPHNWVITNTPTSLQARLRKKDVYFQLQLKELRKRQTATEILQRSFPIRHLTLLDTGEQSGMAFSHGEVRMSAPHVSQAKIDAYVFLKGSQAFLLAMWSKRNKFVDHIRAFSSIAHSFIRYDSKREGGIPRIALRRWQIGDNWESLAVKNRHILGRFTADKLAALNGLEVNEKPLAGQLIKTVR